jgi:hypothetical protein
VADRKPPRTVGDDRETVMTLLQYQRDSLVRKVDGMTDDEARQSPLGSGTTLLWLVQHVGDAELLWVVRRFAGEPVDDGSVPDDLAGAVDRYRTIWARIDAIVGASSLDDLCRGLEPDEVPANLRWVLMHLLEETARHAGHADVLRELLDGSTGR